MPIVTLTSHERHVIPNQLDCALTQRLCINGPHKGNHGWPMDFCGRCRCWFIFCCIFCYIIVLSGLLLSDRPYAHKHQCYCTATRAVKIFPGVNELTLKDMGIADSYQQNTIKCKPWAWLTLEMQRFCTYLTQGYRRLQYISGRTAPVHADTYDWSCADGSAPTWRFHSCGCWWRCRSDLASLVEGNVGPLQRWLKSTRDKFEVNYFYSLWLQWCHMSVMEYQITEYAHNRCMFYFPWDNGRNNNVIITSKRRRDVVLT